MSTAIPMREHEPHRILIVHQEPLFRLGLRITLERQGIQVIGETTKLKELLDMVTDTQPDVILLDGALTFCDASRTLSTAEVVAHIRQAGARGIIVLVAAPNEEQLFLLCLSGAAAYELDRLESTSLVEKVRRVAAGEYLISDEVVLPTGTRPPACSPKILPKRVPRPPEVEALTRQRSQESLGITDREVQILQCAMYGLSNTQIGKTLNITDNTVKNHIMYIFRKLDVRGRTEAVVAALRCGLIDYADPLPQRSREYREEAVV